jgi:transketolase
VYKALDAAEKLVLDGVTARVVNVSTIKPLDEAAVLAATRGVALVATVEEHSVIGGLGSAVAEVLAAEAGHAPLLRLGVRDRFGESALADELLEKHGLQPEGIRASIVGALRG